MPGGIPRSTTRGNKIPAAARAAPHHARYGSAALGEHPRGEHPALAAIRHRLPAGRVGTRSYPYLRLIRPWRLRWGATDDEVARTLPGDGDVPRPTFNATRAVTIAARPEEIWPWLIQIGLGQAGWYSAASAFIGMRKPSTRDSHPIGLSRVAAPAGLCSSRYRSAVKWV